MLSKGKERFDVMIVNAHSPDLLSFKLLSQAVDMDIISIFEYCRRRGKRKKYKKEKEKKKIEAGNWRRPPCEILARHFLGGMTHKMYKRIFKKKKYVKEIIV